MNCTSGLVVSAQNSAVLIVFAIVSATTKPMTPPKRSVNAAARNLVSAATVRSANVSPIARLIVM